MERIAVESSTIASVGYEAETTTLEVAFHRSGVYQYYGVPAEVFEGLLHASSKGSFFDQMVKKPGYPYRRVG